MFELLEALQLLLGGYQEEQEQQSPMDSMVFALSNLRQGFQPDTDKRGFSGQIKQGVEGRPRREVNYGSDSNEAKNVSVGGGRYVREGFGFNPGTDLIRKRIENPLYASELKPRII